MSDELKFVAARLVLGPIDDDVAKFLTGLVMSQAGKSPKLRSIVGSELSDARGTLLDALQALEVDLPEQDDAVWTALRFHMGSIAERRVSPRDGAARICWDVYHLANLHFETRRFVGDSHGIQQLLGNYYAYDDLEERPDAVSCDGKYGEEAIEALGEHIVQDAKDWLERYGA